MYIKPMVEWDTGKAQGLGEVEFAQIKIGDPDYWQKQTPVGQMCKLFK